MQNWIENGFENGFIGFATVVVLKWKHHDLAAAMNAHPSILVVVVVVVVVVVGFIHYNLKHVYFYVDYSIE